MAEEPANVTGLDGLWLTLDQISEFDPVILSTWTFATAAPLEDLRAALQETADRFTRFKCRLDPGSKSLSDLPRFIKDPNFKIENHVQSVELPGAAGRAEFDAFCSKFTSRPWDFSRSPWEAVLATNYSDETGAQSACVMRVYHALSDGQGLIRASLWGSDYRNEVEKLVLKPRPSKADKPPTSFLAQAQDWTVTTLWTIFNTISFLIMAGLTFLHPTHLTPSNLGARIGTSVKWNDKPSRTRTFHGKDGPRQRVYARSKSVTLKDIKTIQTAFSGDGRHLLGGKGKLTTRLAGTHVTLNDVIISVLAEVFHAHRDAIKARQTRFEKVIDLVLPDRVVFCIPISIRKGGESTVKNVVALGLTYLPKTGIISSGHKRTPAHIYESIHRQKFELHQMKKSRTFPRIARRWLDQLAHIPWLWPWPFASVPGARWVSDLLTTPVINAVFGMVHAITTNVPGPTRKVKIAGKHEILEWHIAPPQGSAGTLGVGIMSQNGKLTISVLCDATTRPGQGNLAARICRDFEAGFELYLKMAKQVIKEDE